MTLMKLTILFALIATFVSSHKLSTHGSTDTDDIKCLNWKNEPLTGAACDDNGTTPVID